MLSLATALAGACLLFLAFWGHPRRALVVWLLSLTMVPPWISVHAIVLWSLPCLIGLLAIAATVFQSDLQARLTLSKFDVYFVFFYLVCVGVLAANKADAHAPVIIFVNWVIPYVTARVLVSATGNRFATDAIGLIFGIVGGLAILELVLDWHPFIQWDFGSAPVFELWRQIQYRMGAPRSEWAFGHSIALGGSLALSIPFVARSSFSAGPKTVLLFLIGGGVAATASRAAAVSAILVAGICILNAQKLRHARALSIVLSGVGVLLAVNFMLPLMDTWLVGTARGDRLSALYRGELYTNFLGRLEWFAPYDVYAPGENADQSIDSAVLDVGLRLGWGVLILAAIPLFIAAVRVVSGRATAGEIALVGQIPLFATVALITQYGNWIFVIAGVTVTMLNQSAGGAGDGTERGIPPHPLRSPALRGRS